jgi:hypothetical protein
MDIIIVEKAIELNEKLEKLVIIKDDFKNTGSILLSYDSTSPNLLRVVGTSTDINVEGIGERIISAIENNEKFYKEQIERL